VVAQFLPSLANGEVPDWQHSVMAFLAEKERRSGSARTVDTYARILWPLLNAVGGPGRITAGHVLAWGYGRGASGRDPGSATIAARIACLSSYFRFLIRMGLAVSNPCDAVERPRTVSASARGLSADEVRRLLAVVPDTVVGRRDRAILLVLILTGRRRAEVIGLKAGDLAVEDDVPFYAYRGKGGKRGRRELPGPALTAIQTTLRDAGLDLAAMASTDSLWQAGAGERGVTSGTFYARFRRYLRQASLPPSGIHVLRHTSAKLRRDAGESIEAVSSFLDHSSLAVTTVYLRRLEGETDAAWPVVATAIGAT
jgi:integrase/recombinase XerC